MQALRAIKVVKICFILMSCLIHLCATNCRAQDINCSSACGSIQNIWYPFRLKGDPSSCGHPSRNYELSCIENRTILFLNSKLHLVLSINFGNFTIRLLDPDIGKNNCSEFPRYTLMEGDVPKEYLDPLNRNVPTRNTLGDRNTPVIFIGCRNRVKPSLYVNIDAGIICSNNTLSKNIMGDDYYSYVLVGDADWTRDNAIVGNLEDSCSMTAVAWVSLSLQLKASRYRSHTSYHEIHTALAGGFDLPWFHVNCSPDCLEKSDRYCGVDYNSNTTTCKTFYYQCTLSPSRFDFTFQCLKYIWINEKKELSRLVVYIASGRFLLGLLFLITILVYKLRRHHLSAYDSIENYLNSQNNLVPIRYTFLDIKKITSNFKDKLGEGGFGTVLKGTLRSGPFVAVKMLGKSKATWQDFICEVGTIGRIHHTNVVRLIGFCVEGSKHALMYEFMPNGSLDRYIYPKEEESPSLSYDKMFEISLGVARGIDYLHQGCDMKILHFDIKPHNILLDENFNPKVMGYMAPELFYRNIGGISHKADVYSFGMLLMEMAGRRRNLNPRVEHKSQIYFPSWVYEQFKDGKDIDMGGATEEEKKLAKKMIMVALWCIQMWPGGITISNSQ